MLFTYVLYPPPHHKGGHPEVSKVDQKETQCEEPRRHGSYATSLQGASGTHLPPGASMTPHPSSGLYDPTSLQEPP